MAFIEGALARRHEPVAILDDLGQSREFGEERRLERGMEPIELPPTGLEPLLGEVTDEATPPNVSTEDLAYMLASMGIKTGLKFDALLALRAKVSRWLKGEALYGSLWRAGLPKTMHHEEIAA